MSGPKYPASLFKSQNKILYSNLVSERKHKRWNSNGAKLTDNAFSRDLSKK